MRVAPAGIAVALAALAVSLTAADDARALSCVPFTGAEYRRHADVVLEGVVLSGPHAQGDMASPARVQVPRYIKGRGPSVVEVGTGVPQVRPGDHPALVSEIAGDIAFSPGEVWRIYGDTPRGAGRSAARGILTPNPCLGTRQLGAAAALKRTPGSGVSAPDPAGVEDWRARLLLGPGPVQCVQVGRGKPRGHADCERMRGPGKLLVGVHTEGEEEEASTAVAVAGRGLRDVELTGPDGTARAAAQESGEIALFTLVGNVDPDGVAVRGVFADGTEAVIDRAARRALADDPEGEEPWEAVVERGYPPRGDGFVCVRWDQLAARFGTLYEPFTVSGECGDLARKPLFFAFRRYREYDERAHEQVTTRKVLFGAIGPEVTEVTVAGPDGQRRLEPSREGRAFISAYPRTVTHEELTVTFRFDDGSAAVYEGRKEVGIKTPTDVPLSSDDWP